MSSKNSNTLNPLSLERLQESIKALLVVLDKTLDAVNAVCDEATAPRKPAGQAKTKPQTPAPKSAKQDKLTPGLHPVFKKSAQKAFQNLADSRKKSAEAANPAARPRSPRPRSRPKSRRPTTRRASPAVRS